MPDPNDWIVLVENKIGLDGPKVTFAEAEEERALCGRRPTLWWLIKDVTAQLGTTKRVKPAVDEFRKREQNLVDEVFFEPAIRCFAASVRRVKEPPIFDYIVGLGAITAEERTIASSSAGTVTDAVGLDAPGVTFAKPDEVPDPETARAE